MGKRTKINQIIRDSLSWEEKIYLIPNDIIKNKSRLKRLSRGTGLGVSVIKHNLAFEFEDIELSELSKIAKHNCPSWKHSHCGKNDCKAGLIFDDEIKRGNVILDQNNIIIAHKKCRVS